MEGSTRLRLLLPALAALAFGLPVFAQEQRGSIEGVITDAQGGVVPGTTVEARNASGGVLASTSDLAGVYRFPSVVPGTYTITATLSGFRETKVSNVRVALGQAIKVPLVLQLGAVTEAIEVVAEAVVNTKKTDRSTNIREEFVNLMPKDRDFTSLVTQAAGAYIDRRQGGLSLDGGTVAENKYIVDGVETNNPETGQNGMAVVTDFVEEVQVKSSGYQAEFAGAVGGVVNVITKSGTNAFHGSVYGYFQNDALGFFREPAYGVVNQSSSNIQYTDGRKSLRLTPGTSSNQSDYITYPKDNFSRIEPGFSLGGPIARDRAWFFVSYNPQFQTTERTAPLSNGSSITREEQRTTNFVTANLSAQLGRKARARVAWNSNQTRIEGLLPNPEGNTSPTTNFNVDNIYPNRSLSGNLDYTASSTLYFGVRAGYYVQDHYDRGKPTATYFRFENSNVGLSGVPPQLQHSEGFQSSGSNRQVMKDYFSRVSAQADLTWFVSAGGSHEIKAGVQLDRLHNIVQDVEAGNRVIVTWDESFDSAVPNSRGAFGYYTVRANSLAFPDLGFGTTGDVTATNLGLFLQDSWTIGKKLTLNLGLRTEKEQVPIYNTEEPAPVDNIVDYGFKDKLAPRLGAAYDLKGDGAWKLFGSFGIFYDITKLEMPRGSSGGDKWLDYIYTLDTPDFMSIDPAGCPPACPGRLLAGPFNRRAVHWETVDYQNMKPYNVMEWSGGVEHALNARTSVSLRYVHKNIRDAVDDVGFLGDPRSVGLDSSGQVTFTPCQPGGECDEIYFTANVGQSVTASVPTRNGTRLPFPLAKRSYDGVELVFDKRMAGKWALRGSYLWSRLYGNYTGLTQGDEQGRLSPNVGRNFDNILMAYKQDGSPEEGPLPSDRTHQFKVQAMYSFGFGLSLGLRSFLSSGTPVGRMATLDPLLQVPVYYLGRDSEGRTPFFKQFDLNLTHDIRIGRNSKFQVTANIINVLDTQGVVQRWQTELRPGQQVSLSDIDYVQGRTNIQQLYAAQGLRKDARFLKASQFQEPRQIRLGVRFMF